MKKMRKWTQKEVADFIGSKDFKKYCDDFTKNMKEKEAENRRKFIENIDEWIKTINTPMSC